MNWLYLLGKIIGEEVKNKKHPEKYKNGTTLEIIFGYLFVVGMIAWAVSLIGTGIFASIFGIVLILFSVTIIIGVFGFKIFIECMIGLLIIGGLIALFTTNIGQIILLCVVILLGVSLLLYLGLTNIKSTKGRIIYIVVIVVATIIKFA